MISTALSLLAKLTAAERDIAGIAVKLSPFDLVTCEGNLNGLNGCEKLESITAYNNKLDGALDLTGCTALKTLDVYVEDVEDDKDTEEVEKTVRGNLTSLKINGLKNLTSVIAYNNAITAVPSLEGCEKLTSVNLSKNSITDVSGAAVPVSKDSEGKETFVVTTLNLSENNISDISALEKVTSLTTLDLGKNSISDITAIGKLTTLTTLTLTNNEGITSLDPIVENFPATSTLTLNIIGTKIASDTDAIKTIQDKFSTMKITYMLDKEGSK